MLILTWLCLIKFIPLEPCVAADRSRTVIQTKFRLNFGQRLNFMISLNITRKFTPRSNSEPCCVRTSIVVHWCLLDLGSIILHTDYCSDFYFSFFLSNHAGELYVLYYKKERRQRRLKVSLGSTIIFYKKIEAFHYS